MLAIKKAEKIAAIAAFITLAMAMGKGIAGILSDSAALIADAFHTGADVIAIFASWFGLRIAGKKATSKFPYGYYKAETIATLFVSVIIIFVGVELFKEGINRLFTISPLQFTDIALVASFGASLVAGILVYLERKAGREIGSQSLLANANEMSLDIISSLVVFLSIILTTWKVPYIEGGVVLLISLLVLRIGLKNGKLAIYSLMDASVQPELESEIRQIIAETPGVDAIARLKIRHAGPFVFGEVAIKVKKFMDINRAHSISETLERTLKKRFPSVESFLVHIEPYYPSKRKILIPVKDNNGLNAKVTDHFGRAQYFAFVVIEGKEIVEVYFKSNPFKNKKIKAGLSATHEVIQEKIDALITREIGEISFHSLRDHFVEIFKTRGTTVQEVTKQYLSGSLSLMVHPTHSSDEGHETSGDYQHSAVRAG